MRWFIIILLFSITARSQNNAAIQLLAWSEPDRVLLRWAVDQPLAWKKTNTVGFIVERITVSRNGVAVNPPERQILNQAPLRPQPLEAWETLALNDTNAAILVQALYGDSFQLNTPNTGMGQIMAVNAELEQRHTFALLAAERTFDGALMAGWAFEDKTILPNEHYVYKVSVAVAPQQELDVIEANTLAGADLAEPLPKPIGLAAMFGDSQVVLSWNFNLLQEYYTSYIVERSQDSKSFEQLNGQPVFNAQQPSNGTDISLFYIDSIPNGQPYTYRIKGISPFGMRGPASDILKGKAKKALSFTPQMTHKEILTEDRVHLKWQFPKEGEQELLGFELRRSLKNKGPYTPIITEISSDKREITHTGLERASYYKLAALGKNGAETESFPMLVQPIDSIPPKPPLGLTGIMDSLGIVTLSWQKNQEKDLRGYRIFRNHNDQSEFEELSETVNETNTYQDTLSLNSLNKKVFYKLKAEDNRYNRSVFSEVLEVKRSDTIAPAPPVIQSYTETETGLEILWIPSSSEDVVGHRVYRKEHSQPNLGWLQLFESTEHADFSYIDTEELSGEFSYTITALDHGGLESQPAQPILVNRVAPLPEMGDLKFSANPNRELRFINLSWRFKNQSVKEYRLYKGKGKEALKLYKTFDGDRQGFNDTALEVNTDYHYGLQALLAKGRLTAIKNMEVRY
jgi:hypothetical protein